MLKNGARMHDFAAAYVSSRAHVGLPSVSVEDIVYARAVEIVAERMRRVDLLTGRDVAAAVRGTKSEVKRVERQRQFDELVKAIVLQVNRNGETYRVDAEMENRASAFEGKPHTPVDSMMTRLALQHVLPRVSTSALTSQDVQTAARVAGQRVVLSFSASQDGALNRGHRRSAV